MRWLLAPISWPLTAISYIRWKLYKWGLFLHSKSVPAPVISIGNIALGGTGKTPCAIWLAQEFKSRGYDPVILTRGYKRTIKDRLFILGDVPEARLAGDEPALMASRLPDIPIVIHKNRVESANEVGAAEKHVFILDDGLQHLKLKRDYDIVLLPANDPLSGGYFFPYGKLRDGTWRLDEVETIIMVGEKTEIPFEIKYLEDKIYFAKKKPIGIRTLDGKSISLETIIGEKVVAFCAIGSPESFVRSLNEVGAEVASQKTFRDHHQFTVEDIHEIESLAEEIAADILITTEKDAVRLAGIAPRLTTYVLQIEFVPEQPGAIVNNIINTIERA